MAATPLISVAKRLLANVDADHADYSETIVNVAVRNYSDTDRFEREVENIFHRSPLLVALSCDLREHGDFASLVIAGRPILVVRGKDGIARAFLNICRHRGAPVTEECFGHSRRFTCPYHS
ncbi:MAG: Rieske 2Fe-2S domain-containing protein, partial [Actinomycetes bacterium]